MQAIPNCTPTVVLPADFLYPALDPDEFLQVLYGRHRIDALPMEPRDDDAIAEQIANFMADRAATGDSVDNSDLLREGHTQAEINRCSPAAITRAAKILRDRAVL